MGESLPKIVEETKTSLASKKIINAKLVTVIANSRAEHCIYTYHATAESYFDIKDPAFFNPLYTFVLVGDIIRVFQYEGEEKLARYIEFVTTEVDKIAKTVKAVLLFEKNLLK